MSLDFNAIAHPLVNNGPLDPVNIMNISGINQRSMLDYSNLGKGESGGKQMDMSDRETSFISNI